MILVILLTCDVPRFLRIRISTGLRWIGHDQKCFRFEVIRGNTVMIKINLAIFIWHRMISLAGGNLDVSSRCLGVDQSRKHRATFQQRQRHLDTFRYFSPFIIFLYLYSLLTFFTGTFPDCICILRLDGNLPLSPSLAGVSGLWRGGGDIF